VCIISLLPLFGLSLQGVEAGTVVSLCETSLKIHLCVGNIISCAKNPFGGTWWRNWLRHCATDWEVVGSIPDGVRGIFHLHNPSGHTTALGLTQPLTQMSTRNISWGLKVAGA